MADTIREQIITAFMTRLAAWITANGFNYSCGSSAQRAISYTDNADFPACILWPGTEESEPNTYGDNQHTMLLKIEAFSLRNVNITASKMQEKLLGDAIKIMTDPDVTVTALEHEIAYIGGGPHIDNPEDLKTGISAEFRIKYTTLVGNPYSQ